MARHGFPMPRGGGRICPRAGTRPSAKAFRHSARAKRFAPREKALLGEGLPTWRTSKRICPHEKALLGEGLPTRRTSEKICPRENALLNKSLPTRRTSERICPAQEHAPRRRHPDTAHGRKNLPRARTLSSAKASRHGAKAKGFARAGTRPSAKASRHGARAKEFAPRGSPSPHVPTNGGPPSTDGQPEKHPFGGVAPTARAATAEFIHRKKIRLLHETQLFYGESHVGSPHLFSSFPSVGRCVARERNPVPPVAPHRGSEHRGLRRIGEMVRRFDAMCPRGGELLPRGGRCDPDLRCFGERFHRLCRANPDACRGRRCSRGHDDLGQRAFRHFCSAFRNRRRSGE